MPVIRLTVPKDSWSREEKAEIAARLTDSLNEVAKTSPGKGDIKPHVTVHIEETAEGGYAMGGQVVG